MPLADDLHHIAHRLSTQGAALELEGCVLDSQGDETAMSSANLRRIAETIGELAAALVIHAEAEEPT